MKQAAFTNELEFLSNMYPCKIKLTEENMKTFPKEIVPYWWKAKPYFWTFNSSEHIYQAAKSEDVAWAELIFKTQFPKKTKILARKLIPKTHDLLEGFHENKIELMTWIVHEKFSQNKHLAEKLKSLGEMELVETNYWNDTFWGVCNGVGYNHLGKILMKEKSFLQKSFS